MSVNAKHGENGYVLEDMDWNPETGEATFTYSNLYHERINTLVRDQPTSPKHSGWFVRPEYQGVLRLH